MGFAVLAGLVWLLLVWLGLISSLLLCWLCAISLTAFVAFGFDKLSAISHRLRVPESVLIGLAFAGGTLGALLAMGLFHHKTAKRSFQWRFWLAVVVQILLVTVIYALSVRI